MNGSEWLALATGCVPSLAGVLAVWIQFGRRTRRVEEATEQLRPNGGSSLNDSIRRIEAMTEAQNDLLTMRFDLLTGRVDQHIADAAEQRREYLDHRSRLEERLALVPKPRTRESR